MPVPARRHSKTRTRNRRAHDFLKSVNSDTCSNCQVPVLSHTACTACGFYKGKLVLNVTRAIERVAKRLQKKAFDKSKAADDGASKDTEETPKEKKTVKKTIKKEEEKSE